MRRILMWGGVIFAVYYLATQPANSATLIRKAAHGLAVFGHSMGILLNHLGGH